MSAPFFKSVSRAASGPRFLWSARQFDVDVSSGVDQSYAVSMKVKTSIALSVPVLTVLGMRAAAAEQEWHEAETAACDPLATLINIGLKRLL